MSDSNKPDWKCRLEFVGTNHDNASGKSRKFYQAEVWGKTFVRRWGRIGTAGQTMRQTFATKYEATSAALKMANEEASGSSWHNLPFAASHWQRVEKYRDKPGRKGLGIYYSIAAYDPQTGKLRKVEQVEIDKALEEKK